MPFPLCFPAVWGEQAPQTALHYILSSVFAPGLGRLRSPNRRITLISCIFTYGLGRLRSPNRCTSFNFLRIYIRSGEPPLPGPHIKHFQASAVPIQFNFQVSAVPIQFNFQASTVPRQFSFSGFSQIFIGLLAFLSSAYGHSAEEEACSDDHADSAENKPFVCSVKD